MRLADFSGVRNSLQNSDIAGVTIDVIAAMFAGVALVISVLLLSETLKAEAGLADPTHALERAQ